MNVTVTTIIDAPDVDVRGRYFRFVETGVASRVVNSTQEVGTTYEGVDFGDLSTPGIAIIENVDETNYCEINIGITGDPFATLEPGQHCMVPLGIDFIYAKFNTAEGRIRTICFERA